MKTARAKSPAETFELEGFLPYRLSLLSNTVSEGISAAYRKAHALSVTEWRVIAVLGRFPGQTASEIVERTAMDKVAVSRAVKRLLDRGLLERTIVEADRRRQALNLTAAAGLPLYQAVVPKALAYENRLLASLSADERRYLQRVLQKLQAAADGLNGQV